MTTPHKILLVDDEPDILEFMQYNLKKEGFKVFTAANGQEGINIAKIETPDLIILDIMMPDLDGIETCSELRKINSLKDVFIVFLTARGEDYSQIAGFNAGADDYISKPIKPKVLVSRITAILRRGNKKDESTKETLTIDISQILVLKNGSSFSLPKKEFELLALLMTDPGCVFKREEIMDAIWGTEVVVGDRTIDVHIRKLREKIGDESFKTIKGVGYKFVD